MQFSWKKGRENLQKLPQLLFAVLLTVEVEELE